MTAEDRAWALDQFERCKPWIEAALTRDMGTHGIDDVRELVGAGKAQIWPTPNSVMVTTIETFPKGKVLWGWLAGGDDLEEIRANEPLVADWGRRQGCKGVAITGRKGWLRAFQGYREVHTVIAKDL